MSTPDSDVVLPLPARVVPMHNTRSTLILASLESLRTHGLFQEYESALATEHRDTILGAIAATWIPLEAVLAHYAACDSIALSAETQVQAGRKTFDGARGTLLGTAVRMARGVGVTPWQAMPLFQRFWDRGFDGGAVGIKRIGPKDAQMTIVGMPLLVSPYFRNGLRGLTTSLLELFCEHAYVTERRARPDSIEFRMQWA